MKSFSIAVVLSTVLTFTHAQTDLLSVLRARNLTVFADFLEQRAPNTLNLTCNRNDLSLYAPVNSAGLAPTPANRTTVQRRDALSDEATAAMSISDDSPPIPARRRSPKYPGTGATISDSNFRVRRTFLNDPTFINLGPGVLASVVTNFAESDSGIAVMEAMTGFGKKVTFSNVPIKFEGGVFYEIDSWFTLPGFFTSTIATEGASSYLEAIEKAGLGNKLDNTPGLTVFAPLNAVGCDVDVESYVVYDFLGYTPDLVPGQKYGNITVTKQGAQWYANGAKIVKSDVPTINGIVHFVDNVPAEDHSKPAPYHSEIAHHHSEYDSEPTAYHSEPDHHHHHTESAPYRTGMGFNHSGPGHHHTESAPYYPEPTAYHTGMEPTYHHSEPDHHSNHSDHSNHTTSVHTHYTRAVSGSAPGSTSSSTANATVVPTGLPAAVLTGAAATGNVVSKAAGVVGLVVALWLMA